ncbi:Acg family FMN-binding oxidoreductase [Isoptericola variabilis]|uniref:Acg family FMN-binding oxidoreductase n=1 Tax=Isoptericola variabilis TaxID=139208 RepID=UPI003D1ADC8C
MGTTNERIARIIGAGTRAPSVHNTQPWSVQIHDERHLTVRADPSRQLRHCDPQGREMLISCGAFLMNLRVAAAHEGLDAHFQLAPDRRDPWLAARVTLNPLAAPGFFDASLYAAIMTRRTARGAAAVRPLDPADKELLRRAVDMEHAGVVFLDPRDATRGHLVSTMRRAEALAVRDRAPLAEERSWLGVSRERTDGVPVVAMGGWFDEPIVDAHAVVRDDADGARTFEGNATVAIITTLGDGPCNWLVAGQALERMLLVAATRGIQASFATRVLENPATRSELEDAFHLESRAQLLLRLRYGAGAPFTPRRDVDQVTGPAPVGYGYAATPARGRQPAERSPA